MKFTRNQRVCSLESEEDSFIKKTYSRQFSWVRGGLDQVSMITATCTTSADSCSLQCWVCSEMIMIGWEIHVLLVVWHITVVELMGLLVVVLLLLLMVNWRCVSHIRVLVVLQVQLLLLWWWGRRWLFSRLVEGAGVWRALLLHVRSIHRRRLSWLLLHLLWLLWWWRWWNGVWVVWWKFHIYTSTKEYLKYLLTEIEVVIEPIEIWKIEHTKWKFWNSETHVFNFYSLYTRLKKLEFLKSLRSAFFGIDCCDGGSCCCCCG